MLLVAGLAIAVAPVGATDPRLVWALTLPYETRITLDVNEYAWYEVSLGLRVIMTYTAEVVSGSSIDLYIVPHEGYIDYTFGSRTFSRYATHEGETNITGQFDETPATLFVIVDNTELRGARPQGPVTVSLSLATSSVPVELPTALTALVVAFAAALAAFAVFVLLFARGRRR